MILGSGIQRRFTLAVMSLLVLLTFTVTWVAVDLIRRNAYVEAAANIEQAARSFKTLHEHRSSELLTRAKLLAAEPKIIAALGTPDMDRPTVQFLADEIRRDGDLDLLIVRGVEGWDPAVSVKDAAGENLLFPHEQQLSPSAGTFIGVMGRDVHVATAPVLIGGDDPRGFLTIGDFVRETSFRSLVPLLTSDVILIRMDLPGRPRVMATTFDVMTDTDAAGLLTAVDLADPRPIRTRLGHHTADHLLLAARLDQDVAGLFLKSLEPLESAVKSTVRAAMTIAASFLMISALIVYFLTRAISRPISKLVAGTDALATGNFNIRTQIDSPDELHHLSQSFNHMAGRIQELMRIEEHAKTGLEERVKERTAELSEVNHQLVLAHEKLKEQTSKMIQYEKMASMGTVVAGTAHEINNPLVTVMSASQYLMDSASEPAVRMKAEMIFRNAQRCAEIVKSMERFSRQEGIKKTPVDIHQLVDSAIDTALLRGGFSDVQIIRRYEDMPLPVILDKELVEQMVMNIATNAFQAIRDGRGEGTFTVHITSTDEIVQLHFTDNGPGMDSTVASRIFDPFFTTKGIGRGTGLGLSVAHGIAQNHGGMIYVERTDASGTTIAVELPFLRA